MSSHNKTDNVLIP